MADENNYIWIFGENLGSTADNNSYYFWKHVVNITDGIEKYFVLEKNSKTKKIYEKLSKNEKKYVLWKNSPKHFKKYFDADLFFVTLSYKDITPDEILSKKLNMRIKKPVIYLQHGTVGIKTIGYSGKEYWNNMFRFFTYYPKEREYLKNINDFKDYQLYDAQYHPRYQGLYEKSKNAKKQILWFLTWREYLGDNLETREFIDEINQVLADEQLKKYLKENNTTLKLCTHQFFNGEIFNSFKKSADESIKIEKQDEIDIMGELAESEVLITDYSSVGYDFTFLEKPVILFQPDLETYLEERDFYCSQEELGKYNIKTPQELVETLINKDYDINPFFKQAFPEKIDYDYVGEGKHIDRMYKYFEKIQKNKITFLGFDFYGIGGTVNATMALAEGLLEKEYLVELISLKISDEPKHEIPYGLNVQYLFWDNSPSKKERFHRFTHRSTKYYGYLEYDTDKKYIHPYVGHALTDLMKNIKTNTLVSTRESLHLFLKDCISPKVQNKVYIFNTTAELVNDVFPNAIYKLKETQIDKAVFITNQNRLSLKELYDFDNYESYIILGNSLVSSKILDRDEIKAIDEKEKYNAIYLLRVSEERKEDLDNLIGFAKYVKENNIKNISIDAFGSGNYIDEFIKEIQSENLEEIIHYQGATTQPIEEIRNHDFMIDFSLKHSFGMIYIEAILNGKKVFCMENMGSLDIMEDIPNSYIKSYQWLVDEITNIHKIPLKELQENYDRIQAKYSRDKVAEKFIEYLD